MSERASSHVAKAMAASVLSLRRCITQIRETGSGATVRCHRPATSRMEVTTGESEYVCDLCLVLFVNPHAQAKFVEAPHANALRRFAKETAMAFDAAAVIDIAAELLLALPPCPMPLSLERACERCIWADGVVEDGCLVQAPDDGSELIHSNADKLSKKGAFIRKYVARKNLEELAKAVAYLRPDPFAKWPTALDQIIESVGVPTRGGSA